MYFCNKLLQEWRMKTICGIKYEFMGNNQFHCWQVSELSKMQICKAVYSVNINILELFIITRDLQSGKYTHFPKKIKTTLDKKSH